MKINSAEYVASIANIEGYFESDLSEVLLLGRSNVGKSSFINTILNRKKMAYTSSKPGKTQTLNFYIINNDFHLVDAPGYGYAKVNKAVRKKFGEMIEEYLTNRKNLKVVFLLVDMRHEPTNDDMLMYDFLDYYRIPIVIIATKCDKLPKNQVKNTEMKLMKLFNNNKVISFSSLNGNGVEEVLNTIESYI